MAINLTENVKTYLTYAVTAITGAAVGALILLAGQGINNRLHPKVPASAITGDLVRATRGKEQELQAQLDTLNRRTDELNQSQRDAQRTFDEAQNAVTTAGDAVTEAQQNAVTDAQRALEAAQAALRDHNAQLRAQVEALNAQIANERAVADLIGNDGQCAILVRRLNQIPVPQAQAQESAPANTEGQQHQ